MSYQKPPLPKPEIDEDALVLADAIEKASVSEIFKNCYVSRTTISRMKNRVTKRPQHLTMVGIAAARNLEWVLRKKRNGR